MGWFALGLLFALVVFWAVGAYNRLMRLRAEVLRQWGTVDTVWLKWLMRFQGAVSARQILAWASEADDLQALQEASDALIEALAEARQQALDEASLRTLLERHQALMACIDAVAERVPETLRPHLQSARERIVQNIPPALVPYHTAVEAYNLALSQAPARWLAHALRLRPALALAWSTPRPGVLA